MASFLPPFRIGQTCGVLGILLSRAHSDQSLPERHVALSKLPLMVRVVGLGSEGPEFKLCSAVELIPGGVNSACHPSEVGKMSASLLESCVGVATHPGLCAIAKETA